MKTKSGNSIDNEKVLSPAMMGVLTSTDNEGLYQYKNIPSEEYIGILRKEGYKEKNFNFIIGEEKDTNLDLIME